jgi:hypothetical protein
MRQVADADRIQRFMRALGEAARAPAQVFLTGGATAVLLGWRATTIDIDVKLVPDQDAVLRAIPALKERLQVNVELAAPDDFIPVREGWQERSPFIAQEGPLTFRHLDLAAQALAKLERAHDQDLRDVETMLARGLTDRATLRAEFEAIRPHLYRFPAIDPESFAEAVARITGI